MRWAFLLALAAAPLALGSVYPAIYVPLLLFAYVTGAVSWVRGRLARAYGELRPSVPAARLILALHAFALIQLVPLPPAVLGLISPGSLAFYDQPPLSPLRLWRPVSVNPWATLRGLAFLAGMSLLYATAFREFGERRWRRRLAATVVGAGLLATLVGLVQTASGDRRIYGFWKTRQDWAVFGPYLNRNSFAGFVAMTIPVCLGFAVEAAQDTARAWKRRRRWTRWIALFEREGTAAIRLSAAAGLLIVGLLASGSRGGFAAFVVSMAAFVLMLRRWGAALFLGLLVLPLGAWMALQGKVLGGSFQILDTRFWVRGQIWADALPIWPRFPVLGVGFNAFSDAYFRYQTIYLAYHIPHAHNEYLQALFELGILGGALVVLLLLELAKAGLARVRESPLAAGIFGGIVACAAHNVVDLNWQVPANAATFAVLAGLAMQQPEKTTHGLRGEWGREPGVGRDAEAAGTGEGPSEELPPRVAARALS